MVLLFISSPASLSFPLLFAITEKSLPTITTTSSYYYADGEYRQTQLPFTAVTMATIGELLAPDVPELSLFERLLNHGLFLGAVFQLLCILAVVMLPDKAAATAAAEQGHASPGSSTPAEAEPPRASRHLQGKKLKKESKKKK
ncbi:protein MANBAL [Lampetra fluviatilis]